MHFSQMTWIDGRGLRLLSASNFEITASELRAYMQTSQFDHPCCAMLWAVAFEDALLVLIEPQSWLIQ